MQGVVVVGARKSTINEIDDVNDLKKMSTTLETVAVGWSTLPFFPFQTCLGTSQENALGDVDNGLTARKFAEQYSDSKLVVLTLSTCPSASFSAEGPAERVQNVNLSTPEPLVSLGADKQCLVGGPLRVR